ncbi:hypothetical protein [Fervidobacterium gondwanense]|uniref:hypothetical protein n=1 Tax=Fervidobacterium gondwanense TaxID=44754 RepID=UPI003A637990
MITSGRLHSQNDGVFGERRKTVNKGGKSLLGHLENFLENDGIRLGNGTDVELFFGNVNANENGENFGMHDMTSFCLIERRGQVPAEPNLHDDKGFKPNQLIMVKGRQQTPKMA